MIFCPVPTKCLNEQIAKCTLFRSTILLLFEWILYVNFTNCLKLEVNMNISRCFAHRKTFYQVSFVNHGDFIKIHLKKSQIVEHVILYVGGGVGWFLDCFFFLLFRKPVLTFHLGLFIYSNLYAFHLIYISFQKIYRAI